MRHQKKPSLAELYRAGVFVNVTPDQWDEQPAPLSADVNAEAWVIATDPHTTLLARIFDDGTYAAVRRLMFHYTLIYGIVGDNLGYENRWCYQTLARAAQAMVEWDYPKQAEPEGWHRNPRTGRRRPDGDATKEYIDP